MHLKPETDRAFAVEAGPTGKRRIDADGDVTPMNDCSTDTYCSDTQCDKVYAGECWYYYYYEYTEGCCRMPDGSYECEIISPDCGDCWTSLC